MINAIYLKHLNKKIYKKIYKSTVQRHQVLTSREEAEKKNKYFLLSKFCLKLKQMSRFLGVFCKRLFSGVGSIREADFEINFMYMCAYEGGELLTVGEFEQGQCGICVKINDARSLSLSDGRLTTSENKTHHI